jgi:hypothetical protein
MLITSAIVTQMHNTPKQNMITLSPSFSWVGQQLSFVFLPVGARGMFSILSVSTGVTKMLAHRQLPTS